MALKQQDSAKKLTSQTSPWFSTTEILEYLCISNNELLQKLSLFTEGVHYKLENPEDPASRILWRVDLVDELLCLPVPPLEREAMLKAINNDITCQE